ncbi:MAG: universal stress protein [archaeon]|nr:universal stress protein [archaeon]
MTSSSSSYPGSKVLVTLDATPAAGWAFQLALLQMDKRHDLLVLMSVVELFDLAGYGHSAVLAMQQDQSEREAKALVRKYGMMAKRAGVAQIKLNITYGPNVGEAIVNHTTKFPVDCLYIGRRPIEGIKRFFLGSISKHVVEHAACNVVVVKTEFGPEEEHGNKAQVVHLEEQERARRIREDGESHALQAAWSAKQHTLTEIQLREDEDR